MNWCQTERMNLKYVEINWNVIFQKSFSSWFEKAKEQYPYNSIFYHFYVSTKVNMNKFETNELMSNWKEWTWNMLK